MSCNSFILAISAGDTSLVSTSSLVDTFSADTSSTASIPSPSIHGADTQSSSPASPSLPAISTKYLLECINNYSGHAVSPQNLETLRQLVRKLPTDLYISKENAEVVFRLLRNPVLGFDYSRSDATRNRLCNILLGMKNCGKSFLVGTLLTAIKKQYPNCVTLLLESSALFDKTIAEHVLDASGVVPESDRSLDGILALLKKQNIPLLLVVDEAQDLYPRKDQSAHEKWTQGIVGELRLLAQRPGCVCWLTGSTQALYHLAFEGRHPQFHGVYSDLNEKKYTPMHYVSLHDRESIKEFFLVARGASLSDEEADQNYAKYGGAVGDLLYENELRSEYIERWDPTARAVLLRLVLENIKHDVAEPWNLQPIPGHTAYDLLRHIKPGCVPELEMRRLCDLYLLERDNQDQYRVAYPEAIKYGRGLMFHTPTDRFVHIQVPLLCFPVYAYLLFCLGISGSR